MLSALLTMILLGTIPWGLWMLVFLLLMAIQGCDVQDVLANVSTGGLYGIGEELMKGRPLGAVATTGPFGNVAQPTIGTGRTLSAESAGVGAGVNPSVAPLFMTGVNAVQGAVEASPTADPTAALDTARESLMSKERQDVLTTLPRTSADLFARGGAGASPELLAGLLQEQAPGLDPNTILAMVRQYLRGGTA